MKQTYYSLILCLLMFSATAVLAQPANDNCTSATSLGTLPAPAACTGTTGTKKGRVDSIIGTNVNATPSNPYPYISACPPSSLTNPPLDVWYSFVASSYQTLLTITNSTITNPVITVWEGSCAALGGIGCVTGAGGAASLTVLALTPGQTYYVQVSGSTAAESGTFTLKLTSETDCANCLVASTTTATPPPTNGFYQPGTTVTFCDSIYNWDQTSSNWLHGVVPTFGPGWNLATLTPSTIVPGSCSADGGFWAWYSGGDTSSATGNIYGAGFFYETSLGNANFIIDNSPGNNYGDNDASNTCSWKFCFTITTNIICTPNSNLGVSIATSGDGESGSWTSVACANDPITNLYAVGSCCPPTMTSTPATCANANAGTATATPTGTYSPWSYHWSNGTIQDSLTGPSTITGLSAGTYIVTVTDATNCSITASVTVTGPSINGGPNQTVSCVTLPGGTATMAGVGTGTWTTGSGNPGTATITTPSSPTTTITNFSAAGTYHFVWTVSGCTDTVSVVVTTKPNAGPDKSISCVALPGGSVTMAGTGTGTWTAQAGNPGTATITTPTSPTTTITTFSTAGTYKFIWTNGTCTDTANVVVTGKPNAGPDQTVTCYPSNNTATMAATGTGTWTALAGNPGTATITTPTSPTTTITTFSVAGTYHFIWTSGGCTDTAAVIVTAKPNAGPDETITCFPLNNSTTMAGTGTGTWTAQTGNPGTATITTPTSPTTTVTAFSAIGTYKFIWTNGGCSDTANVVVTARASAGPNQTVSCVTLPGGSATMAATGTGTWTAQAGNPGTATITTPTSPTTTITTFSAAGTYNFIWTSGGCTDTASVIVTAKPNAGPDETITCFPINNSTTMAGTGTGTWTAQAGNPGTATITTPTSPTTTITAFSAIGTYTFIWTNAGCSDTANVIVTGRASAGPNQAVSCVTLPGGSATMGASGTGTWTAQTGNPGTATITTPTSPTTTITTFSVAGTYNFIWTSAGGCSDTAAVIVTAKPNAGPDQIVTCFPINSAATMAATGTGTWTAQTGNPGTATITTPTSPTTTITAFSVAGTYNFIWTNGGCTDTASVIVTTKPNAGPNQTVSCVNLPGGSATMAGTGSGTWTAQAGNPGTATITTPTSPTTTITTFSVSGTYNFIWTSAGGCSDTAAVTITAKPNAGPDQTVSCIVLPGGSATMAATGTGIWTAQTGNPGTATITTPTSPTTTITGFTAAGIYNFIWTGGGCTDTAAVIVIPIPNAGPDQTVSCITLPGGSVTMAGSGIGAWFAQTGNPGSATITSLISPTTTITGFTAAGTYYFIYTNGSCSDTAAVVVTAKPNAGSDQAVSCIILPGGSAIMAATGAGTWTALVTNPGTSTITNPTSASTTITTFSAAGTYYYVWTNGSGCTDTAAVMVTTKPNAGPDDTLYCVSLPGGSASMAATGTGTWSAQTGNPGTATITSPTNPNTTITTFSTAGTYYFIWTSGTCTDTASVTITAEPVAGPAQTVNCAILPGGSATMAGTGSGTWTALGSNPGTATITSPTSPTTAITTFSTAGVYYFVWTNGSCADTTTVTVTAQPDAGPNQTITCYPGNDSTSMAATGTGVWTAQAGNPGTAVIVTPGSPTTIIDNFSAAGIYTFVWTNGTCSATATVTIIPSPSAGPDQTVSCVVLPGGTATMAATGTGTWAVVGTNPGTATITSPNSANTTITTFSAVGTYYFVWANGGCTDTAAVTVTAKPDAGTDTTVCVNTSAGLNATGTGSWSALTNNPATTTITSPNTASTTINGFTVSGSYGYVWTSNGCTDTAFVNVNPAPTVTPTVTNITCTNATGAIFANASGASPFTYLWSTAGTSDSINTTSAGTPYTVTVTDNNQCTASATASVSNLIIAIALADSLYDVSCYGYSDGKIVVYPSPAGQFTYAWSNSGTTDSITGLTPGTYSVVVTDSNGCSATASYTITSPSADTLNITPIDTLITLGDTVQLSSTLTGLYPGITYSWTPSTGLSCTNCPNPILVPVDTNLDVYQLIISYNNGCSVSATDTIKAKATDQIGIPDAFTPNGDGKNDAFVILGTGVKSFKMNIYNRWGEQVFSTTDITVGWDGTYKGSPEPQETYMYFFTMVYLDGKTVNKEGSFMLLR